METPTQAELNALESKIATTRERFLAKICQHADLAQLHTELHEMEALSVDIRRGLLLEHGG